MFIFQYCGKDSELGNTQAVFKRRIDPDIFKAFIKSKGVSIRQLGSLCATNEKTIRRILQDGEVTLNVALDLSRYFDTDFETMFGVDDSRRWRNAVIHIIKNVR